MKKITVKHYLYKRIKPDFNENNEPVYPVYVKVIYNRKSTNFRSDVFSGARFTELEFNQDVEIQKECEIEVNTIVSIVGMGVNLIGDDLCLVNIHKVVPLLKETLSEIALSVMIDYKQVKKALLSFISIKTGMSFEVVRAIAGYTNIQSKQFREYSMNVLYELCRVGAVEYDIMDTLRFIEAMKSYSVNNSCNIGCCFDWYMWQKQKGIVLEYIVKNTGLTTDRVQELFDSLDNKIMNKLKMYMSPNALHWG